MTSLASQAELASAEGVYRMDEWDADLAAACHLGVRPCPNYRLLSSLLKQFP